MADRPNYKPKDPDYFKKYYMNVVRPKVGGEPEPRKSDGLRSKYAQTLTKKSCCEFGAVL